MKIILKFLLAVASLIGLACSVGVLSRLYEIPYVTYTVDWYSRQLPLTDFILAAFSALICLVFVVLFAAAVLMRVKPVRTILVKDRGKLNISIQTVESTARCSFAGIEGIGYCAVKAKLAKNPEKTKIRVKLSFSDSIGVSEKTEAIRAGIDCALKESLGISAKYINIEVAGISKRSAGSESRPAAPRRSATAPEIQPTAELNQIAEPESPETEPQIQTVGSEIPETEPPVPESEPESPEAEPQIQPAEPESPEAEPLPQPAEPESQAGKPIRRKRGRDNKE